MRGEREGRCRRGEREREGTHYSYSYFFRYAHEEGCPWDEHTPESAAMRGHLHCLKYVSEGERR